MAFQTGSFTSAADLIATIKSFCTANGWTVSGDVISKGTVFTALTVVVGDEGAANFVKVQGGTGESAGALTGASTGAGYALGRVADYFTFTFPGTYYLFYSGNPDAFVCVVRSNEGFYFNWLLFGMLTKYGSYTGGEYFGASYLHKDDGSSGGQFIGSSIGLEAQAVPTGGTYIEQSVAPFWAISDSSYQNNSSTNVYVRSDIGLETGAWLGETSPELNAAHANVCAGSLIKHNPNAWNNQPILIPFWVVAPRASGFYSLLGLFSPARICRVTYHEAGDIITLGSDKYMVFPFHHKNLSYPNGVSDSSAGSNTSGTFGWAIAYDGP